MRYLLSILAVLLSVSVFAQDFPIKADGETKYYIQIYDGQNNDKILYHNNAEASWKNKIQVTDFFDGSQNQLWSFTATANFPGYFHVKNHDEAYADRPEVFMMSWNWIAYLGGNHLPEESMEMQFRLVEVTDGWYKFETIEKPNPYTGIAYTPGADALNLKPEGYVSFSEVKSADITPSSMVNKAFKLVEFDPLKLFLESIVRGGELYDANPTAPESLRYDLFYILEKARELRVFGTEAEMLAYQPTIDAAIKEFNEVAVVLSIISDARDFIANSGADTETTNSFNQIVNDAEAFINSEEFNNSEIAAIETELANAQSLVEAIVAAQTYAATLEQSLTDALTLSIDAAKVVLADESSSAADYLTPISHLEKTQDIIAEIVKAQNLIAETSDYPDEKAQLNIAIDDAMAVINTEGTTEAELNQALADIRAAIETFKSVLSTPLVLNNADFELVLTNWNIEANDPLRAYTQDKGFDGKSLVLYGGSAYDMKIYQSLSNIPNGTYLISCYSNVNGHSNIGLFAESDGVVETLAVESSTIVKHEIEITVTNRSLNFGIKGLGVDNAIPGGNWIVADNFEVKWTDKFAGQNFDFETAVGKDFTGWDKEATTPDNAYPDSRGIDGSQNVTCWSGSAYDMSISQTHNPIANGEYEISVMGQTKNAGTFVLFGESNSVVNVEPITLVSQTDFAKYTTLVTVTDNIFKYGIKGAGTDNAVGAGEWVRFDNFGIIVKSITPVYVTKKSSITLDIDLPNMDSKIQYFQNNEILSIRSNETILNYAIYSVTGSLVEQNKTRSNELTVSLKQGFYIVKVQTEKGFINTKKVMVK